MKAALLASLLTGLAIAAPGENWEMLSQRMKESFHAGHYVEAAEAGEAAVKAAEESLGGNDLRLAKILAPLSVCYFAQGKSSEAIAAARRALDIYESRLGKDSQETLDLTKILGVAYAQKGDFDKAEPLLQHALELSLKYYGERHVETAKQLGNLGGLYRERDRKKARQYLEQALKIWGDSPDPIYGAMSIANLAQLNADEGRIEEADRLFRRALALRERAFGREHPQTKAIADSYAEFLKRTKKEKSGEAPR